MKKVLSIMAAVVLLIAMLAACGGQPAATSESTSSETSATEENAAEEKSSDKKIIAYVLNSVDDWAQTYVNAGREKCEEYGFEALEMNPESDVQKQIDYVQSCISQNVDLIAIQPIDNAALAPMLKKANEAGIMVNSVYQIEEELGCDFVIYTVYGQYEAGQMAGKAMVEAIGEKGKVGIIAGNPGASNVVLRSEGFRSVVAEYPDITIVNEIACQWDRSKAMAAAEDMITANPDLVGIFSMGDQMAHGIIEAVNSAGKQDAIQIVTVDAGSATQQAVLDGKLYAAVDCPPNWFAEMAAEILKLKVDGKEIEKEYIYTPKIITKDNADPASAPY